MIYALIAILIFLVAAFIAVWFQKDILGWWEE